MKKIMTVICAIVLATISASAKDIRTAPFNKVQVDVEARVRVIDGYRFGVNVRSTDKDKAEGIKVSVDNGVLTITGNNSEALKCEDETTVITITCPTNVDITAGLAYEAHDVESDKVAEPAPEAPSWARMGGRPMMHRNFPMPHNMPFRHMM